MNVLVMNSAKAKYTEYASLSYWSGFWRYRTLKENAKNVTKDTWKWYSRAGYTNGAITNHNKFFKKYFRFISDLPLPSRLLIIFSMQEGTIKFFNETKGFGFIKPDNGGQDIFVHVSGLIDEVRENDRVSFEVQNGKKGLNAVNVKVI